MPQSGVILTALPPCVHDGNGTYLRSSCTSRSMRERCQRMGFVSGTRSLRTSTQRMWTHSSFSLRNCGQEHVLIPPSSTLYFLVTAGSLTFSVSVRAERRKQVRYDDSEVDDHVRRGTCSFEACGRSK